MTTKKHNEFPFDVHIMPDTLWKLNQYAAAAQPNEIGGLARLNFEGKNIFVTDVKMLPQEATAGTFDITADDINKFTLEMVQEGRADELHEWCSIVHSHPVGMGPNMSGTDIAAIKRYAEEADAFSLIISASRSADSKRLLMHYCTNVRGEKVIYHDIPVSVGTTVDFKENVLDKTEKFLVDLGVPESAAKGKKHNFITQLLDTIPFPIEDEEDRKKEIQEEVKTLIKTKAYGYRPWGGASSGGYTGNSGRVWRNGQWEDPDDALGDNSSFYGDGYFDSIHNMHRPSRTIRDEERAVQDFDSLSANEVEELASRFERFTSMAEKRIDPLDEKTVTKKKQDLAKKRVKKMLKEHPWLEFWTGYDSFYDVDADLGSTAAKFKPGELVILRGAYLKANLSQCQTPQDEIDLTVMTEIPHAIDDVLENDAYMVSGFEFFNYELRKTNLLLPKNSSTNDDDDDVIDVEDVKEEIEKANA